LLTWLWRGWSEGSWGPHTVEVKPGRVGRKESLRWFICDVEP